MTKNPAFHTDPVLLALATIVQQIDARGAVEKPLCIDLTEARNLLADAARRESGGAMSDVTSSLISELRNRDTVGIRKYGTTLDREDLDLAQWLQHMKEEMLDGAGYAQAAINKLQALRAINGASS